MAQTRTTKPQATPEARQDASLDASAAATARGKPMLPAERAFVVQLRADADVATGAFTGRVEHVLSGTAAHFESMEELVRFVDDALRRRAATPR